MVITTEQALAGMPEGVAGLAVAGAEFFLVSPGVMDRIAPTATPSGLLGVVEVPKPDLPPPPFEPSDLFLCLDGVSDPGNAGTLIRSADAAGASAVLVMGGADPWNPKAVRATMGSCFHLPVVTVSREDGPSYLMDLRSAGMRIVCTSPHIAASLWECDLTGPAAIVVGNEAHGLSRQTLAQASVLVTIPNFGRAESLNVAQAGTVLLFEAARQISARRISCAPNPAQV
jgi:TrmH family RNA methyltransferase